MNVQIKTGKGDKFIGTYDGKVYRKTVKLSKHLFFSLDAWGIDKPTLQKLSPETLIEITETEEKKVYTITKEEFEAHAVEKHFQFYGPQHFCPRRYFKVEPIVKKT